MKTTSFFSLLAMLLLFSVLSAIQGCGVNPVNAAAETKARDAVVLLHGLGRGKAAMWWMALRLENAGYDVHRIDYDSFRRSPAEIIASVEKDIAACCAKLSGALHFVGHSLGGLLIRAYLDRKHPENLGNVVLIGTPNHGTDLVDKFRDSWWMQFAGDAALSLGTDAGSFPNSLPPPDYAVGVIAGKVDGSKDDDRIAGPDDGLVPVSSTRVEGMRDFLVVDSGHSAMRYDSTVTQQTINFLKHGRFRHAGDG